MMKNQYGVWPQPGGSNHRSSLMGHRLLPAPTTGRCVAPWSSSRNWSLLKKAGPRPTRPPPCSRHNCSCLPCWETERADHRLQAWRAKVRPGHIQGREVCSSQKLIQKLPHPHPHALPSSNITLTLDNSKIPKTSLCNGPLFMVLQKQETLNQTNDSVR